ncbi:MAG: hypothetical protein R6X18_01965 [Chloroflexota bacterium]|jgi:hypothetical protein
MYPEDRVLVAYVPNPSDFEIVRREGWYRIPQRFAPKGLHAEIIAFYFGSRFDQEKWAIHYYAPNAGHELVQRRDLFPDEPDHPHADGIYYKIQLGPLQKLAQPIVSLRWRRVTFIHTTWDRFRDATEINDLFIEGGPYVDRLYYTLKERGVSAERDYRLNEDQPDYVVALSVPTRDGRVNVAYGDLPSDDADVMALADAVVREIARQGGPGLISAEDPPGKETAND